MEMILLKKSYDELGIRVQELETENLRLKMKIQTLEAFLQPVDTAVQKNCGSGCRCSRSAST
jgi:hypothetical protein